MLRLVLLLVFVVLVEFELLLNALLLLNISLLARVCEFLLSISLNLLAFCFKKALVKLILEFSLLSLLAFACESIEP